MGSEKLPSAYFLASMKFSACGSETLPSTCNILSDESSILGRKRFLLPFIYFPTNLVYSNFPMNLVYPLLSDESSIPSSLGNASFHLLHTHASFYLVHTFREGISIYLTLYPSIPFYSTSNIIKREKYASNAVYVTVLPKNLEHPFTLRVTGMNTNSEHN